MSSSVISPISLSLKRDVSTLTFLTKRLFDPSGYLISYIRLLLQRYGVQEICVPMIGLQLVRSPKTTAPPGS